MTSTAAQDTAVTANQIAAIVDGSAKQVTNFVPDTTDPEVDSFVLDVNAGTVTLTLSEAVNAQSVVPSKFTLQSASNSSSVSVVSVELVGEVESPTNGVTQIITLNNATLDAIKLAESLGTVETDTYLTASTAGLTDMAGRALTAIPSTTGQEAVNV
jgi:hypothetical protein